MPHSISLSGIPLGLAGRLSLLINQFTVNDSGLTVFVAGSHKLSKVPICRLSYSFYSNVNGHGVA